MFCFSDPVNLDEQKKLVLDIIGKDFNEKPPLGFNEFANFLDLILSFDIEVINHNRKFRKLILMFISYQVLSSFVDFPNDMKEEILLFFSHLHNLTTMESLYMQEVTKQIN